MFSHLNQAVTREQISAWSHIKPGRTRNVTLSFTPNDPVVLQESGILSHQAMADRKIQANGHSPNATGPQAGLLNERRSNTRYNVRDN